MTKKAGIGVAVLDDTVLEALGQLQGKYDAEFVARMITMFMETALILLIRLQEGIANRDIIALHHASHELKSCSATIGAYSLSAHCERLERIVRDGHLPDPDFSVDGIDIEYRRVEAALIARLAELNLVGTDPASRMSAASPQPASMDRISENLKNRRGASVLAQSPASPGLGAEVEVIVRDFRRKRTPKPGNDR
jgi:HPt (histidine-containing phosphotransfer) domain-containing protein